MVDYYKVLKVKRTASAAEIKSAYRKLARERHPDVNGGSEGAAREFALISLAYRTLSDPQERAFYDSQLQRAHSSDFVRGGSVFHYQQPARAAPAPYGRPGALRPARGSAHRGRPARELRASAGGLYDRHALPLDLLRRLVQAALLVQFQLVGRAVVVTLFFIGLWHLAVRLKACFEHYTYQPKSIHDSIINGDDGQPDKPFTRFTASTFLIVGSLLSIAGGLYLGSVMKYFEIFNDINYLFGQNFRPDLLFYPPIAVLIVDTMHNIASKID